MYCLSFEVINAILSYCIHTQWPLVTLHLIVYSISELCHSMVIQNT